MDVEESELLRESVRNTLTAPDAPAALLADGWAEVVSEYGDTPWRILFEEGAASLSAAPLLDFFVLRTLGIGEPRVSVVYPRTRTSGYVLGPWAQARSLLWLEDAQAGIHPASGAGLRAVEGIDPELGLGLAELEPAGGGDPLDARAVRRAIARARLMQAYGLLATGRHMLDLALAHVTERTQFGKPVASFQAVKHQLADCAVELESSSAVAGYAAEADDELACLTARALAGRAAFVTGRAAGQVMGAMGFTWEIPLHRHVRRLHIDDAILGPWERLAAELGGRLLESGRAPRLGAP